MSRSGRPDLKNNRQQIALIEARMDELFLKLDSGEHGAAWARVLKIAREVDDLPSEVRAELLELCSEGLGESANWRDLQNLIELRRKAVETDSRIAKIDATTLNAEQTMFLVGVVVNAAREFLEPDQLQEFAERVSANTPGGVLSRDAEKEDDWS